LARFLRQHQLLPRSTHSEAVDDRCANR
jgi:hypothetical protein